MEAGKKDIGEEEGRSSGKWCRKYGVAGVQEVIQGDVREGDREMQSEWRTG